MIPFDFIYCRPDTLKEAVKAYAELDDAGKSPLYYGGGSEIITMCRAGSIMPGAVIDIKNIPETLALAPHKDKLIIGASNSLNKIKETEYFPLLGKACGRIADHTNQCRITLGGNMCGTIIYRETVLPLLLADAEVTLYSPNGLRTEKINSVFEQRMLLLYAEFVVSVQIPCWALQARFFHIKKTANEKIDYPLVNVTALDKDGQLRVAFSGLCPYPFRSTKIEQVLNDNSVLPKARVEAIPALLPDAAHSDVEGSGDYRLFVLKNTLLELLEEHSNGSI